MSLKRLWAFTSWAGVAAVLAIAVVFGLAGRVGIFVAGVVGLVVFVAGVVVAWRLSPIVDTFKPWWRMVDWVPIADGAYLPDVRADAETRLAALALTADQIERSLRIDSARTLDGGTYYRIYAPRPLVDRAASDITRR
jgi:hypothetical protein